MTTITWDSRLPPLRGLGANSGTDELHPPTQDTQFDDGPDRSRRRSLFVTTPLSMAIPMRADQFVIFKDFHLNKLNAGARRFRGPVLSPDLVTTVFRTCKIQGKVAWKLLTPTKYLVSFTLLVQDW